MSVVTKTTAAIITVAVVVGVGALKTAGVIDADTMTLALTAGGFGGAGMAIGGALSKGGSV